MSFTKQQLSILRRYTGINNQIKVTVINKLGQEFVITGYIPKAYSNFYGIRVENKSVQDESIILRYADDKYSSIQLFLSDEPHGLNIKKIETLDDIVLYENENYIFVKLDILADIEDKYGDENYFTTSSVTNKISQALLGKVVTCRNDKIPNIEDKKCIVTKVSRTKFKDVVDIGFIYGTNKSTLPVTISDIKKTFYFVQPFVTDLEF